MSCQEYFLTNATIYQMLKKSKINPRYDLTNLTLKGYHYDEQYTGASDYSLVKNDEELSDLPTLEGVQKINKEKD